MTENSNTPKITQEMINLYDDYTHITLDRRAYMTKLSALVGSTAAAATATARGGLVPLVLVVPLRFPAAAAHDRAPSSSLP